MSDQFNQGAPTNGQPQQYGQQQPPKKKHTGLIVAIVVIVVVVVLGFGGCAACSMVATQAVSGNDQSESLTTETSDDGTTKTTEGIKLYNKEGISINITEKGNDTLMGAFYTLEIKNKSKNDINVSIDKMSVDGKMVTSWFYEDVAKGKTAEAKLQTTDIKDVSELVNVEAKMKITNAKDYSVIDSQTITIK